MSTTTVSVHKDDGSITLATDATAALTAGNSVVANSDIGTGPFGTTSGDFDFYKVFVHADQLLTIEINAQSEGSALDSIVGVYDANGNFLDSDDDSPFNMPNTFDSYLQFTPTVGGYYYVAVGQFLQGENVGGPSGAAAFPSDPFTSSTGPGVNESTEGIYKITMSLAAFTPVAPVAVDDSASTNEGASVAISVLDNDIDDGILLPNTLAVQTQPADGKALINKTTGVITYVPNAKFSGVDTFTYKVTDYDGLTSNIATVTVDVLQVSTPPVAVNDSYTVSEQTPTVLNILANDTDLNDNIVPTTVNITTQPSHGTISINSTTGAVTYTPANGYLGADSFQYKVSDDQNLTSNVATVTLRVVPAPPVANPDSVTTPENTPVTINELANDTATAATLVPSSVAIVGHPTNGTATIGANGEITYTPNANYSGPDTITYTVGDSNGSISNVGTITITVSFVDYPPVAVNDSAQTNPNTPVTIPVLTNDTDENNDISPSTVTVTSGPANGTAVVNTTTGAVTYTPNTNFSGNDSFTYTVATTHGAVSNPATVTIHVHQPPMANPDTVTTLEETPVVISVLSNDTDPEGATILPSTVMITSQPSHGTVSVNTTTGQVQYTPAFNFSGTDTFDYTVADSNGVTSLPGLVTVNVTFVPKAPVAANDFAGTAENTPVTANVLTNDIDYDSTLVPGSVTITSGPANGTAVANANGTITYTPSAGFTGADQLTYTVQDQLGKTSNPATLDLRVGPAVTLSGVVYVDSNDNGVQDAGEIGVGGVTITLTKTNGPVTFSLTTTTAADGSYSFSEAEGTDILPLGTYTLTETSPIFFVDGKDTAGNVSATITKDQFSNIVLTADQPNATGFNFGELGLSAQYVAAYVGRRAFLASSTPDALNLNLAAGAAYFALAGGNQGTFSASATGSGDGTTTLTLYNSSMQVLATSQSSAQPALAGSATQTNLTWSLSKGAAALLVVTGTDTDVNVDTSTANPAAVVSPTTIVSWHNSANPLDVNGDGSVSLADALAVINALNSQGPGLLGTAPIAAHDYLDVAGTGTLSPSDAIDIINALNAASATHTTASAAVATPSTDALATTPSMADASTAAVSTPAADPGVTLVSAASPAAASPAAADTTTASDAAATDSSATVSLGQVAFAVASTSTPAVSSSTSATVTGSTSTTASGSSSSGTSSTSPASSSPASSSRSGSVSSTSLRQTLATDAALEGWELD